MLKYQISPKTIGIILIVDAVLSLFLPRDKQIFWQIGRIIRLIIGLYLILI
jgi:hypothetical protein